MNENKENRTEVVLPVNEGVWCVGVREKKLSADGMNKYDSSKHHATPLRNYAGGGADRCPWHLVLHGGVPFVVQDSR